jgi:hypothetical protein
MTYGHLVYLVLDELKLISDDATYTEEHIIFLANKYRAFILKQRYSDVKKEIPESNYQSICLDLIAVPAISGEPCEGGIYLRSTEKIPSLMPIGNTQVYPLDYYQGNITFISRERMRYVGYNKYLQNIIYCSLGPDNYLYFKSYNPQFLYLQKVRLNGVFEDTEEASKLSCEDDDNSSCDILDKEFPLEGALVPPVVECIVKELSGAIYKPKDEENNSSDDLAELASFIRNNAKTNLQKQIEG